MLTDAMKAEEARWPAAQVALRPVAELTPYARNARTHSPAQIAQLAASMQEWGFTIPVLVDEAGGIIAGHARVLSAELLELPRVPVMVARGWTEAQKRAYVIADNRLAENAGWDEELLRVELADLAGDAFDMTLLGFPDADLARLTAPDAAAGLTDPDAVPDLPANAESRAGEVWQLGEHRLACGDCRDAALLERLMEGRLADAVWTDPPYGVDYSSAAGKIQNDDLQAAALEELLRAAFSACAAVMKNGAPIYVTHADSQGLIFRRAFVTAGFKLSGCLIWRKDTFTLSRSDYQWQHEPILYGWRPGAAHRWYGGRKQATMRELVGAAPAFVLNADGSLTVRVGDEAVVISGRDLVATPIEPSVIHCAKPRANEMHPTVKPVELIERTIRNSAKRGDLVLDVFGGSGSTLIACQQLGMAARVVELDPRYCDVIVRRWEDFTGKRAQRAMLEA